MGSVRQLTDSNGAITYVRAYDPYGVVSATSGSSQTSYAYTGEYSGDYNELVYLRARFYAPSLGGFLTKDPSGTEANSYLYALANPINRGDRTGLNSGLDGLGAFIQCFDYHTLSHGVSATEHGAVFITAKEAVDTCKLAYSKDAWTSMPFGNNMKSAHNLFGTYIYERGGLTSLIFHAEEPLTRELARSATVQRIKFNFLWDGATPDQEYKELRFGIFEQAACLTDYRPTRNNFLSLPLTCLLGSIYYQVKEVTTEKGTFIGFRIDNRTDLGSGTHIALRFEGGEYGGSVEDLILNGDITGNETLLEVLTTPYHGKKVVTILNPLERSDTGNWTDQSGQIHDLGGGNLTQTYVWMEKYDPCNPQYLLFNLKIEPWRSFEVHTTPIREFNEFR